MFSSLHDAKKKFPPETPILSSENRRFLPAKLAIARLKLAIPSLELANLSLELAKIPPGSAIPEFEPVDKPATNRDTQVWNWQF